MNELGELSNKFAKETMLNTFLSELIFRASTEMGYFQCEFLRHQGQVIIREMVDGGWEVKTS